MSQNLPQYVGYREVQKSLGVSRRTVERMVRIGSFPRPVQLAPNRVGWPVETVTTWLAERSRGLVAHAVAHAEDLEPEQLEDQALQLIQKSLELRTGKRVEFDALDVRVTRSISEDELKEAVKQEFSLYAERFSEFDKRRAYVMAAWLFASLRADIEYSAPGREKMIYGNREVLEGFGQAALNDEDWEDLIARFDDLG